MKKILLYLSTEKHASAFDIIVAHDSGVDVVVPYDNVKKCEIADIIYHSLFPRGPDELKNTAVFIGGHDLMKSEQFLRKTLKTLEGLPLGMKVSVAVDPDGAYTTATACVKEIKKYLDVSGKQATVLAGTGPVGQSVGALLAREKAHVALTSRDMKKADETTAHFKARYGVDIESKQVNSAAETRKAVCNADIVVSAGPAGVLMLPEEVWSQTDKIKVIVDLNSVPPYGVGGVEQINAVTEKYGKTIIGSIHIGNHKMRIHQQIIKQIFADTDQVFDLYKTYELA